MRTRADDWKTPMRLILLYSCGTTGFTFSGSSGFSSSRKAPLIRSKRAASLRGSSHRKSVDAVVVFWAAAETQATIARRVVAARVRYMRISVKAKVRPRLSAFDVSNVVVTTPCVINANGSARRDRIMRGRFQHGLEVERRHRAVRPTYA